MVPRSLRARDIRQLPSAERLLAIVRLQNVIACSQIDYDGVMRVVVERAAALTRASSAVVELVEGDGMVYGATSGQLATHQGFCIPREGSLAGLCVELRCALKCDDTEDDQRVNREACRRVGARSMVVVPLFHDDDAVGVLKVVSDRPRRFTQEDVTTLELLADVIAASLHHAKKYASMLFESQRDALTGLLNRRSFDKRLREAFSQRALDGRPFSVVLLDLDDFKLVNDRHGHAAGDAALRNFAGIVTQQTRATDSFYRLGGDEFALLLPETDDAAAGAIAARIATSVRAAGLGHGILGSSVGAAEVRGEEDESELLGRADRALYLDKSAKRARREAPVSVRFFGIATSSPADGGRTARPAGP